MNKYSIDKQMKFNFEMSSLCEYFRKKVIRITLNEMSIKSGIPVSTLSSFEQGRSSNLRFMYIYLVSCETQDQKNNFVDSVRRILDRSFSND